MKILLEGVTSPIAEIPYEVYFGDGLRINSEKIVDTSKYAKIINDLVAAGGDKGREMYEKMSCIYYEKGKPSEFEFDDIEHAKNNFKVRLNNILTILATESTLDIDYYHLASPYPGYPRIGDTIPTGKVNDVMQYSTGSYWQVVVRAQDNDDDGVNDFVDPYCNPVFIMKANNNKSYDAIINGALPLRTECQGTIQYTILSSYAKVWGKKKFEEVTKSLAWGNRLLGINFGYTTEKLYDNYTKEEADQDTLVPGDYIPYQNYGEYRRIVKKLAELNNFSWMLSNENCFYTGIDSAKGGGLFSGLGMYNNTEANLEAAMKADWIALK